MKEGKKGRTRGDFIIGKKKDWNLRQGGKLIQREEEGMILTDLILGRERLSIVSVYGEQGGKNVEEKMNRIIEGKEEGHVMLDGDFNENR